MARSKRIVSLQSFLALMFLFLILFLLISYHTFRPAERNVQQITMTPTVTEVSDTEKTLGFDHIYMLGIKAAAPRVSPTYISRWNAATNYLATLKLNIEQIDNIFGGDLNRTELFFQNKIFGKKMLTTPLGTIACGLSHMRIWQDIVKKGYKNAIIMEDDLRFTPNFLLNYQIYINELNKIPHWHLVFLVSGGPLLDTLNSLILPPTLDVDPNIVQRAGYHWGSNGYAVSLEGAKLLIEYMTPFYSPVDVQIGEHHNLMNQFVFFPRASSIMAKDGCCLMYDDRVNEWGSATVSNYGQKLDIDAISKIPEDKLIEFVPAFPGM